LELTLSDSLAAIKMKIIAQLFETKFYCCHKCLVVAYPRSKLEIQFKNSVYCKTVPLREIKMPMRAIPNAWSYLHAFQTNFKLDHTLPQALFLF